MSIYSEKSATPLRTGKAKNTKHVLVIHGGAGTFTKAGSTPEQRVEYRRALEAALKAGHAVLADGGDAMDAVVAAVSVMEDNPMFNAGKGAVFNVAGKNELETSLMLSKPPASNPSIPASRRGFALTLLTRARNPSQLVRAMYLAPEAAPHTMMSGETAENIGADLGAQLVDPSYFFTQKRWAEHRRGLGLPEEGDDEKSEYLPQGTVGAVALDVHGCIAALTSTGGKTNKLVGRVGDTPLFGSGFWAEEWETKSRLKRFWAAVTRKPRAVGVSGTGDGDYFIRLNTASTLGRRMRYLGESVRKAGHYVVEELRANAGVGGLIALDNRGNVAFPMNCTGMYRGVVRADGKTLTAIFDDDELSELYSRSKIL
ncbi:asparaginase [Exidia glandulosa HHB12029]|uniref:Asparaginase n=1 Tax=Exidia glandulosa HHB12029 TaxID=1314781 RepID=A0A165BF62_EXIGL|nr:asparaginase [Exidia glandulosa HHB12029]